MKKMTLFFIIMCIISSWACSCANNNSSDDVDTNNAELEIAFSDVTYVYSDEKPTNSAYLPFTAYISSTKNNLGVYQKVEAINNYQRVNVSDYAKPNALERDFTFMQKSYVGSYIGTNTVGFDSPSYTYKCSDTMQITVDVNGRIIQVSSPERFTYAVEYANPEELLSPETYVNYAFKYLSEILGEITASRYEANTPDLTLTHIWVTFDSKDTDFEGFNTFDEIRIVLDMQGNLLEYKGDNVGLYKDKKLPDTLTEESIIEMIRASLTNKNVRIELSEKRNLVILSDGRMACYTNFRIIDNETSGDWAKVLIPLE